MRYEIAFGTIGSLSALLMLIGCGSGDVVTSENVGTQAEPLAELGVPSALLTKQVPKQAIGEWHKVMSKAPLPENRCFRASHPSMNWEEVPCGAAPSASHLRPWAGRSRTFGATVAPETVGAHSGDSSVTASSISSVAGSFPSVSGVLLEDDPRPGAFSLQINSNTFGSDATTGACTVCAGHADCKCWQQFVFDNPSPLDDSASYVYTQRWLLSYGSSCPSSEWTHIDVPELGGCCFNNSHIGTFEIQKITNLANLALTATAVAGGNDTLAIFNAETGQLVATSAPDSVLGLSHAWNFAEFNVFGRNNAKVAAFNPGSTLVARMSVTNGTTASPTCATKSESGETNNLNLVPASCCATGGASPAIEFLETNAAGVNAPFCLLNDIVPIGSLLQ